MKLLGKYKNGNYNVVLFDDGTKVRQTKADKFIADFPECMDIKITNYCNINCPYCHEASSNQGKHGDILDIDFINTLKPYTELAIGGGNPLSHPDLSEFLRILKEKKIIANITINQKHFMDNLNYIESLVKNNLIKGLGISLTNPTEEFIKQVKEYPNAVIHVIIGVVRVDDLTKMYGQDLKILILGYKQFRKGKDYFSKEVLVKAGEIYSNLQEIIDNFKVVSFDNLAIEQLEVKRLMTDEEWNSFYMGDDGKFTMYIDLVNRQFARCSVSDIRYPLFKNIVDMFKVIKEEEYGFSSEDTK